MKHNRNKLISLMREHGVNCVDVAKLLNLDPNTPRVWRCATGRSISDKNLELLKFKLEQANVQKRDST